MAITQAKTYVPVLDEVYKLASLTAVLDSNEQMVKLAANGKQFLVPKMSFDGLGNTTRGGNYVGGDVTLEWETKTPDYDRNRMFSIDSQDNIETAGVAYGMLAGEFIRAKVTPENDAFRFAKYAAGGTHPTYASSAAGATLSTGAAVIEAIRAGLTDMDDNEVPEEGRILFITPALLGLVEDLDTTKSKEVLAKFSKIVKVPQSRFYTKITLKDGTTDGQTTGGYGKTTGATPGYDINFMIVHPSAIIQALKHVAPKIVSPEENQNGDNWKFGYRVYAVAEVLENKAHGVYFHNKAA